MNARELAAQINGREYRDEMTRDEEKAAKAAGLVVVFGASDDLMEFRGAVNDEVGAYNGGKVLLTPAGLLINDCGNDSCPYFMAQREKATVLRAKWNVEGFSWVYETTIPHETFTIVEEGEMYCRGIVFALADVPAADGGARE